MQRGAGEGNRTLVLSLEGFSSTIELHPPAIPIHSSLPATSSSAAAVNTKRKLVEGEGFEPSKAEPSDLQSDPFDRSGTPPAKRRIIAKTASHVNAGMGNAFLAEFPTKIMHLAGRNPHPSPAGRP